MLRLRIHLIIAVGISLCLLTGDTFGKPIAVHKNHNRGRVIAPSPRPAITVSPVIKRPTVSVRPYGRSLHGRHYFHRMTPKRTHRPLVIVRTPYGRIIKAYPGHRIISRYGYVERPIVRVWFMNTNGSRTGVELVRRSMGYIGPRGEWYREIPTKRQLLIAYGF